jgi:hypothetical protein
LGGLARILANLGGSLEAHATPARLDTIGIVAAADSYNGNNNISAAGRGFGTHFGHTGFAAASVVRAVADYCGAGAGGVGAGIFGAQLGRADGAQTESRANNERAVCLGAASDIQRYNLGYFWHGTGVGLAGAAGGGVYNRIFCVCGTHRGTQSGTRVWGAVSQIQGQVQDASAVFVLAAGVNQKPKPSVS